MHVDLAEDLLMGERFCDDSADERSLRYGFIAWPMAKKVADSGLEWSDTRDGEPAAVLRGQHKVVAAEVGRPQTSFARASATPEQRYG